MESLAANSEFIQLLRVDRRGRLAHQVLRARGLREGDDVAERLAAGHHHRHAVESEGDAAVGRSAVAERLEQKSEALSRLLLPDAERAEHARLQLGAIDS